MIFISYSRKDRFFMRCIQRDLAAQGFDIWVDDRLRPGTPDWPAKLATAIQRCDVVIVLLSPNAKESTWVSREIEYASTLGKRILPVMVRGQDAEAIPIQLILHQWIDLRDEKSYTAGIEKITATILDFVANFEDDFSRHLGDLHHRVEQNQNLDEEDLVQYLQFHWKRVTGANVRLLIEISGQFKAGQFLARSWLYLLSSRPDRKNVEAEAELNNLRNQFVLLQPAVHEFAAKLISDEELTTFHERVEENLISWLDFPGDERGDIALIAGDALIHLGWKPLKMRQPVLNALRAVMMAAHNAVELRREAGFRLLCLRWLSEVKPIPKEEVQVYFDLVDWFVGNPDDLSFHIDCLTRLLDNHAGAPIWRAHLLVRRAVSMAKLWLKKGGDILFQQAKSDYEEAEKGLTALIAGGEDEDSAARLRARIFTGLGNFSREQSQGVDGEERQEILDIALNFHKKAVMAAEAYQTDVLVLTNAYNELGATHIERGEWEAADRCYRIAIRYVNTIRDSDHALFISLYARICEVASMGFWDRGYALKAAHEPDSPEFFEAFSMFARAYAYADFALTQLKSHEPFNAEDLAYAQYNAFASLTEFFKAEQHGHPEAPRVNHSTEFFAHLLEVVQLAGHLSDPQVQESIIDFYQNEFGEIVEKVLTSCENEQNITQDTRKLIGMIVSFLREIRNPQISEQVEVHLQEFTQLALSMGQGVLDV